MSQPALNLDRYTQVLESGSGARQGADGRDGPGEEAVERAAALTSWLSTARSAVAGIADLLRDSDGEKLEKESAEFLLRAAQALNRGWRREVAMPGSSLYRLDRDAHEGAKAKMADFETAYRELVTTLGPYKELCGLLARLPTPKNQREIDYELLKEMSRESWFIRERFISLASAAELLLEELLNLVSSSDQNTSPTDS